VKSLLMGSVQTCSSWDGVVGVDGGVIGFGLGLVD